MKPTRGKLLVRPVETAETFAGGRILIPHATREAMTAFQAEVVAVGDFAECDPTRSRAERKCARPHALANCDGCPVNPALDTKGWTTCCSKRIHPHPIVAGDWVLLRPRATLAGPDPERPEMFVHQDDVLGIFKGE